MDIRRPPVITIMGHVDHGKTSILDKIRNTNIQLKEEGGITQSIGAYQIKYQDNWLTFIDTPGHYAFARMRARGSVLADIVILVIAADDGFMPQTEEALSHAKSAQARIIVAINKIDLPGANINKIKGQLAEHELNIEEYGGNTPVAETSTITGEGIDNLLQMIIKVSKDIDLNIKEKDLSRLAIVEAYRDDKKGPIVHGIVRGAKIAIRDFMVAGEVSARIRSLKDWQGNDLKEADISTPVEVLGFDNVPEVGEEALVVESQKVADKMILEEKARKQNRNYMQNPILKMAEKNKQIPLVVKADSKGTLEVVINEINKLNNEQVQFQILLSGVGNISESDILLAVPEKAIVVAFNVGIEKTAEKVAREEKVIYRLYSIIYELIEELTDVVQGEVASLQKQILGKVKVKKLFELNDGSKVAGCEVISGKIRKGNKAEVVRDRKIILDTRIVSLRIEKDDVNEVKEKSECGIKITDNSILFEGDVIQAIGE